MITFLLLLAVVVGQQKVQGRSGEYPAGFYKAIQQPAPLKCGKYEHVDKTDPETTISQDGSHCEYVRFPDSGAVQVHCAGTEKELSKVTALLLSKYPTMAIYTVSKDGREIKAGVVPNAMWLEGFMPGSRTAITHCAPDMHPLKESEYQEIMERLKKLERKQ